MNKSDKVNRNSSLSSFIFVLFLTSFDLRSSLEEKFFFFKELI